MQGIDLSPILDGSEEHVQDCTMVECRPTRTSLYQQSLISDQYKLVVYRDGEPGELYDLHADPDQYENLWANPAHTKTREALMHRLARFHMEREGRVGARVSFS
jgi:hypothetical protein